MSRLTAMKELQLSSFTIMANLDAMTASKSNCPTATPQAVTSAAVDPAAAISNFTKRKIVKNRVAVRTAAARAVAVMAAALAVEPEEVPTVVAQVVALAADPVAAAQTNALAPLATGRTMTATLLK